MPYEEIDLEAWAKELGIDYGEILEKQSLIRKIIKRRNKLGLTQGQLADLVEVSQPRIAQIETGIKTYKITFDILFKILKALGCSYKITVKANRAKAKPARSKKAA
jgi:transcriptional regulator with XRE-family HTH domain